MRASIPEPKVGDLIEIFRPFYKHWAIYVGDGYVVHLAPPSLMVSLPGFQPAEPTAPMLVSKPEGLSLTQSLIHRAAGREVVHHGLPKDSFIINDKEAPEGDAFISREDSIVLSDGEIAGAGAASIMSALTEKAVVKKELLDDVVGRDRYRVNNKHDGKYSPLPPSKIVQRAEELVGQELPYSLPCENCEHFVNDLRYGVARSDQVRDAVVVAGVAGVGLAAMGLIGVMFSRNKRQTQ